MKQIFRDDLIKELEKSGIDLGKNPQMTIRFYEFQGLIPKATSKGYGRGKGKAALYPEIVISMIQDLKFPHPYLIDSYCRIWRIEKSGVVNV